MLTALDLLGTFVFALSGAFKAVRSGLDWLGIAVLAVLTGVGGGLIRDVLLGDTPPASFRDERYLFVCLAGAVAVIVAARPIAARWNRVMIADALGLGLFAAIGALKGAEHGLGPVGVVVMGALTAVGGGVIRDILVNEQPAVLYKGFYATAAVLGGAVLVALDALGAGVGLQFAACAVTTSALRFLAMARHVRLPRPSAPPDS
ncbi:trimeric intracellular cation channel family protein [Rubrivirga sp. IMCC43871]|uniref:trimeric intracellular cation channel family protein n=1 Tax=Rubrivirga sp. IMCC43871 TaxID=3391575 RepID=UPI00399034DF